MAYGGLNKSMDAVVEIGRNPVRKDQIEYGFEQDDAGRDGRTRLERPNSRAGIISVFPVQLKFNHWLTSC